MDRHAQQVVARAARGGRVLAALLLALAGGCAGSAQLVSALTDKPAPPVTQVVAMWNNQVITGVDPAHNGTPMYGVAGRVFLFGADLKENLLADGKLVVELYATPPEQPQGPPVMMQSWEIKKDILNSVYRRTDGIGQGYSLSLPWPNYRPDIAQVQIQMRYEPEKGVPVFTQNLVALNSGQGATPVYSSRTETGNRQPIVAAPPAGTMPPAGTQPPRGGLAPAGGMQPPGGMQPAGGIPPVNGMPLPGGVQPAVGMQPVSGMQPAGGVPPAVGMPQAGVTPPAVGMPQAGVTQPGATFPPACTLQPGVGLPMPGQVPYQPAPQPPGAFQPTPPAQGPCQVQQLPGGFQR